MLVVSNSTPLIYLAKIDRLELLRKLFDQVYIPIEVFEEVVSKGKEKGYEDAYKIEELIAEGEIIKKRVKKAPLKEAAIGRGEMAAIKLAVFEGIKDILIDEAKGRRVARAFELKPKGTLWVLTKALERSFISKKELEESLRELVKCGYRIKKEVLIDLYRELSL